MAPVVRFFEFAFHFVDKHDDAIQRAVIASVVLLMALSAGLGVHGRFIGYAFQVLIVVSIALLVSALLKFDRRSTPSDSTAPRQP